MLPPHQEDFKSIIDRVLNLKPIKDMSIKPVQVRLRLLDVKQFINGISDIMIPVEQLSAFKPLVSRVFITENEINGLSFPDVKESLVIFKLRVWC